MTPISSAIYLRHRLLGWLLAWNARISSVSNFAPHFHIALRNSFETYVLIAAARLFLSFRTVLKCFRKFTASTVAFSPNRHHIYIDSFPSLGIFPLLFLLCYRSTDLRHILPNSPRSTSVFSRCVLSLCVELDVRQSARS